ncbi:MAG: inositol phosphorylceramide synthase [Deltaproteobacteria bacterium]|nr:inositol phosphorylceramide synthase [Deltaproteobacteria bacterium]
MQSANKGKLTPHIVIKGLFDRLLYRIATLGFDLIILMAMTLLLIGSVLAMGGHVRLFQATVLLPIIIMVLAIAVKVIRNPSGWYEESIYLLRDWVPFVLVVFIYENMHDVAGQVMAFDIAGHLLNWDIMVFGIEPTIWAQKVYSPLMTDIMSITYALYFVQPLFIMFLLSVWKKRYEFRHMALCLTVCLILGFLGYVFLPCSPPRYFIEHMYTDPVRLQGLFLFNWLQGTWDGLSVISGGAFPSLHVGLSAAALIYAFKFRKMNLTCRIVWYAYVPLVTALWFSTIYLRHHWILDIVAGLFVAGTGYMVANFMMPIWRSLRQRYELPF